MEETEQRTLFERFKRDIGRTLLVLRVIRNMDEKMLVKVLKNQSLWVYATEPLIKNIEKGDLEIDFERFCSICQALGSSVDHALKTAKDGEDIKGLFADMTQREQLEMIKQEAEYLIWKSEQQSEE